MTLTYISGRIASTPVAWVSSGRHAVVPFGRVLHVFDITQANPACVASLRGHTAKVVSVVSVGKMRVASASEDGTVRFWDVDDGSCLKTVDMGQKLYQMCIAGEDGLLCSGAKRLVLLAHSKKGKSRFRTLFQSLEFGGRRGSVATSLDGVLVTATDKRDLLLTSSTKNAGSVAILKHRYPLTAVAVSQDGSLLAAGDERGSIFVYPNPSCILPNSSRIARLNSFEVISSCLHWHSSSVGCLAFSSDSSVLFSGGEEAAVVTWKMTRNRFGERSVLPRLKSSIRAISLRGDDSIYALSQGDNSVRFIQASSNTVHSMVRGVSAFGLNGHSEAVRPDKTSGALQDFQVRRFPLKIGCVVIAGTSGDVQLLDTTSGLHISEHNVVPRNSVSHPEEKGKNTAIGKLQVTAIELSQCGTKMATIDTQELSLRTSSGFGIEEQRVTSLRFWDVRETGSLFTLSAVFTQPHGRNAQVTDLCFHPHLALVATASSCGTFKLWRKVLSSKDGWTSCWRSEIERGYRQRPCNSICFSNDGSLLAVACGSVLTVWNVEDLLGKQETDSKGRNSENANLERSAPSSVQVGFLHALVHPPMEESIRSVSFLQNEAPLFIVATEFGVYVWNALTQGIWWSTRIRNSPRRIAVDMESGFFAIPVEIPALSFSDQSHVRPVKQNSTPIANKDGIAGHKVCSTNDPVDLTTTGNASDASRGDKRLASRKRLRSEQGEKTASSQCDSARKNRTSNDWAVALFDAKNPIPVRICRLETGTFVNSLQFVSQIHNEQDSTLVCVDSNLDISLFGLRDAEREMSASTSPSSFTSLRENLKESSKIDALLGPENAPPPSGVAADMQVDKETKAQPWNGSLPSSDDSSDVADVWQAFRVHFDGPVHVQAPVSQKSFDFVKQLLPTPTSTGKRKEQRTGSQEVNEELPGGFKAIHADEQDIAVRESEGQKRGKNERSAAEYEACRALCTDLISSYFEASRPVR